MSYNTNWGGGNIFWRPGNWYGGVDPVTGESQDWYNTPLVRDMLSESLPYGEWTRFFTEQGYGGNSQRDQLAQSLIQQAQGGYEAAQLSNPDLTFRRYLNTLQNGWLDRELASMTAKQRGAYQPAMTRVIRWG